MVDSNIDEVLKRILEKLGEEWSDPKVIVERYSNGVYQTSNTMKSSDTQLLASLYQKLYDELDKEKYYVMFNQKLIKIGINQDPLTNEGEEEEKEFNYEKHIESLLNYMVESGISLNPLPKVHLIEDEEEAGKLFGRTAYYNPVDKEVILYTLKRHPKDVLRSLAHEMIHHKQNLEGRLDNISTTNITEDDSLKKLEEEAYLEGNITFRSWEDTVKSQL